MPPDQRSVCASKHFLSLRLCKRGLSGPSSFTCINLAISFLLISFAHFYSGRLLASHCFFLLFFFFFAICGGNTLTPSCLRINVCFTDRFLAIRALLYYMLSVCGVIYSLTGFGIVDPYNIGKCRKSSTRIFKGQG